MGNLRLRIFFSDSFFGLFGVCIRISFCGLLCGSFLGYVADFFSVNFFGLLFGNSSTTFGTEGSVGENICTAAFTLLYTLDLANLSL